MTSKHKSTEVIEIATFMSLGNQAPLPYCSEGPIGELPFDLPETPGRRYKITVTVEEIGEPCPHTTEAEMAYTVNCIECGAELRKRQR